MWPKSRLSSSVSGKAPQLTGKKSLSFRSLWAWIARAINSLPVPLSPVMSTVAESGRHFLDHLQDVADRLALADDVFEVKFHLIFRMQQIVTWSVHLQANIRATRAPVNTTRLDFRAFLESFGSLYQLLIGAKLAKDKLQFLPLDAGRDTEILHGLGDLRPTQLEQLCHRWRRSPSFRFPRHMRKASSTPSEAIPRVQKEASNHFQLLGLMESDARIELLVLVILDQRPARNQDTRVLLLLLGHLPPKVSQLRQD